jgi:hypothetical protein
VLELPGRGLQIERPLGRQNQHVHVNGVRQPIIPPPTSNSVTHLVGHRLREGPVATDPGDLRARPAKEADAGRWWQPVEEMPDRSAIVERVEGDLHASSLG